MGINWEDLPTIDGGEAFTPIPLPETDLTEYPYGWIYVRDIGFFEVDSVGQHEWILAEIELALSYEETDVIDAFNSGRFAEKLLCRKGVAYMSSTSAYIFTGHLENLSSSEFTRFTRDTIIKSLFDDRKLYRG